MFFGFQNLAGFAHIHFSNFSFLFKFFCILFLFTDSVPYLDKGKYSLPCVIVHVSEARLVESRPSRFRKGSERY